MSDKSNQPAELTEQALDEANGGIGLLVPAVQKIREAAARADDGSVAFADGSVRFLKTTTTD